MDRKETLQAALNCVMGNREQDYGTPEDNFTMIGERWTSYIKRKCVGHNGDVCINPEDVAAMMIDVKISRIATGHAKADNWVDIAGYAACGGEIESGGAND